MTRVAALYDIHGNLPALEAVLLDVQRAGVGQIVFGGDVLLGPGVEHRRTPYDFEKAAERVRAPGYPGAEEFAAGSILHPQSELKVLEKFCEGRTALKTTWSPLTPE